MKVQRMTDGGYIGAEFDVTVNTAEFSVPGVGHGPDEGTVKLTWTTPYGGGSSWFRLTLTQPELIRLLNDTLVKAGSGIPRCDCEDATCSCECAYGGYPCEHGSLGEGC